MKLTLDDPPFAGRTGKGVVVAVLDSGIHQGHPHVGHVARGTTFVAGADANDVVDRIGHGTAVAAAIREKSPGAELVAVRIFDRQLSTNVDTLTAALLWSVDSGATLINLSLGTANYGNAARLADAVDEASRRGALIVSARESSGVAWFPGSLATAVGVVADWACERDQVQIKPRDDGLPVFSASPYPRPIPGIARERNLSGVSFAVANVTGFLARAIEAAGGDPFEALRRFERAANGYELS